MDSGDLLLREIAVCKKSTLTKARIERSDWRTAQVVDEAMDRLATGALHDEAASFLRDKMVSPAVMARRLGEEIKKCIVPLNER